MTLADNWWAIAVRGVAVDVERLCAFAVKGLNVLTILWGQGLDQSCTFHL